MLGGWVMNVEQPPANEALGTAVRTLLSAGLLVDSAHRKPEYLAVSCHRTDEFGIAIPYLVVLGDVDLSLAAVSAARQHAEHEGAHLVVVSDDYVGEVPALTWSVFLARLGGPLRSWLPLEDTFNERLLKLGHNELPPGLTGTPNTLFEEYVLAGLQFMVGNRVIRYGQNRLFERVPDGVGFAGDPPSFFAYDAKAAEHGYVLDIDALRQFGEYVQTFNRRYRSHLGTIHSFLVVSGHFDMTAEAKQTRADEMYAAVATRLSFMTASAMGGICQLLRANPVYRSVLPWRDIFSRLDVEVEAVKRALEAVKRDQVIP
jgi:hypothetical protein